MMVDFKYISSMNNLRILLVILSLVLPGSNGDGPDLSNIQRHYERSHPGFMICYYYGSTCRRDSEVCSPTERACVNITIFPENATDYEKCAACRNFINKNDPGNRSLTTDTVDEYHGYYDACVYIIGKMTVLNKSDCCGVGRNLSRKVGHELCPSISSSNDSQVLQCRLGEEFCTPKGCEPLFANEASDEDKIRHCQTVIKQNDTEQIDACMYALGLIHSQRGNLTQDTAVSVRTDGRASAQNKPSQVECGPKITNAVLGTLLAVVLVAVAVGILFYKRKWVCFKKQRTDNALNRRVEENDLNLEKALMLENAENTDIEGITGRNAAPQEGARGKTNASRENDKNDAVKE